MKRYPDFSPQERLFALARLLIQAVQEKAQKKESGRVGIMAGSSASFISPKERR